MNCIFRLQASAKLSVCRSCIRQDEGGLDNTQSAVYRFCLWMVQVHWLLPYLKSQWKSIYLFPLGMCTMNWPNLTGATHLYGHFLTKEAFTQCVLRVIQEENLWEISDDYLWCSGQESTDKQRLQQLVNNWKSILFTVKKQRLWPACVGVNWAFKSLFAEFSLALWKLNSYCRI